MRFYLVAIGLMVNSAYAGLVSGNIVDDIKLLEPETSNDYAAQPPNVPRSTDLGTSRMEPRYSNQIICHIPNSQPAPRDSIQKLRNWLYSLASQMPVSAQQCSKLACKFNTAVWLCNDNLSWTGPNSITIAYHIDDILADPDCETAGNKDLIQGQAFDVDGYNVIVSWDACEQQIPGGELPPE